MLSARKVLGKVPLGTTLGSNAIWGLWFHVWGKRGAPRLQGGRTERGRSYRRGEGLGRLTEGPWRMNEQQYTDGQEQEEEQSPKASEYGSPRFQRGSQHPEPGTPERSAEAVSVWYRRAGCISKRLGVRAECGGLIPKALGAHNSSPLQLSACSRRTVRSAARVVSGCHAQQGCGCCLGAATVTLDEPLPKAAGLPTPGLNCRRYTYVLTNEEIKRSKTQGPHPAPYSLLAVTRTQIEFLQERLPP
ncbi:uncharacterized protein [Physeter macrocephalus]|uniref:Uncharacterized protein n=1 Tax=Physeter macrocephalus TaxID=9755 RepID=A0A455AYI5_PHYMC|nr:uncharacterized protein LOC114485135 [Physeter catodon]|eukprot:XP_028341715.1 uncharacterized protein LOC114485135 [Physeter catodon]